jgi:hypothetical protein
MNSEDELLGKLGCSDDAWIDRNLNSWLIADSASCIQNYLE